MPDWMKGGLFLLGIGVAIWLAWNVVLVRSVEEHAVRFDQVTTQVGTAGQAFGEATTLDGCLAEITRRVGGCEADMMCATMMGPFVWGCLESAPYDPGFCQELPDPKSDAVLVWGEQVCARHGHPGDPMCPMVVGLTASFCSTKRTDG